MRSVAAVLTVGLLTFGAAGVAALGQGRGNGGGNGGGDGGGASWPEYPALAVRAQDGPKATDTLLLLAEADGTNQAVLVDGSARVDGKSLSNFSRPIWSPNGEWVIFGTEADGVPQIGAVRSNGEDLYLVPDTEGLLLDEAEWSRDGGWIVYQDVVCDPVGGGCQEELHILEVDPPQAQGQTDPFVFDPPYRFTLSPVGTHRFDPSWSGDSSFIAAWSHPEHAIVTFAFSPGQIVAMPAATHASPLIPDVLPDIPLVGAKGHDTWFAQMGVDATTGSRDIWFVDTSGTCGELRLFEGPSASVLDWSGDAPNTAADDTDTSLLIRWGGATYTAPLSFDALSGCPNEPLDTDTFTFVFGPMQRSKLNGFTDARWRR